MVIQTESTIKRLREKARAAFEERKLDPKKRLQFLKDAKILDENGDYNPAFFATKDEDK